MSQCPMAGVGGFHSEAYYDDGSCKWCGARGGPPCEDCGRPVLGSEQELAAIEAGIPLCDPCIEDMADEADAYDREMGGYKCSLVRLVEEITLYPTEKPNEATT